MSDEVIIPGEGIVNTDPIFARFQLRQGTVQDWEEAILKGSEIPFRGEPIIGWDGNKPILKIGDGNNITWNELPTISGGNNGGSEINAKDVIYDQGAPYVSGSTVDEALYSIGLSLLNFSSNIDDKAPFVHTHNAAQIDKVVFTGGDEPVAVTVDEAIDYLITNMAYLQEQIGEIETALDSIIAIQNNLIGGSVQ